MSQITTLEQLQQFYKAPHPIVMKKAIQALEQEDTKKWKVEK